MESWELQNKRVKLILKNGYRYAGPVQHESPAFLTIHDERDNTIVVVAKEEISNLQVLP